MRTANKNSHPGFATPRRRTARHGEYTAMTWMQDMEEKRGYFAL